MNMDRLGVLMSACQAVNTDKVTERKKQLDIIQRELLAKHVLEGLDTTTREKHSGRDEKIFTWDTLFLVAKDYMWKELATLQKAKSTATTQKKQQDVCRLINLVTKQSHRNAPNLSANLVVDQILLVLKDEVACEMFGQLHCNLLQKRILPERKHRSAIKTASWQKLLAVHLELLIEHPKNFDCLLIAETICGLSRGVCEFCDPQARHILPKMLPFFADIKNEKSNFIINKIVKAATALCGQLAYDNRIGVCKFGEDVAKSLLWLLANSPADYLKHSVIEFLQVQMMCHHPGGARTAQEGAMAHDWDEWKSQLRKMYEVIYIQLQELQRQGKFLSNSELHGRQISWCDDFFCLAADVCQQMFADHASIVDVTQTSFMDAESGCTAAKKRRLQSGWSLLTERLSAAGERSSVRPWLLLLSELVKRHPQFVPINEVMPELLGVLYQLFTDSKRGEMVLQLLRCLLHLSGSCHRQKNEMSEFTEESLLILWNKIWLCTMRTLSFGSCKEEAYQLLASLVRLSLVSPSRDLWSLFVPSQCPFHPEAIPFLSAFLHHHQLPEDYQPPVMGCVHQAYEGNYPLRLQLIDWLLPNQKDASDCSPQIIINTPSAELAHLLLCLCMRDTMGATSSYASTALHPLEDIFLKNSFIIPVYDSLKQEKKASTSERISSCLTGVYDKMISAIVQQTRLVLEQPKEAGRIEIFAWYASFIGNIMSEFLDVLSESSEIASILNDLLKKITQLFPDMKISAMDSVLIHLADLFHLCSSDKCLARLIHSATPDELLKKIMFLVFDAEKCTGNNNGSVRLASCDFDDFDVDGNDVGTDQPDSEDSSSGLQSDHEGLLSTSMLSSKDAKRLRAVSLLCEWCCHGNGEKRIPPVMTKLLDLVDGEKDWFDVEEAFSLQAFQCLVEGLCSPVCSPSKDAIETLIQSMQISGKFHHTDPTIASAILNLMSVMLKRLNDSGEETTSNAYGNLKRLLMAFYKLSKDSLPSQCRESLANCMFTFVQLDPMANSADDGRLEICQILPDFLLDLSHRVRMTMAANMHCILMEEADQCPVAVFESVNTVIQEVLQLPRRMTVEEQKDALLCRRSSCLRALAAVSCLCPALEKHAIFAMLVPENNFTTSDVCKVLEQLVTQLEYPNLAALVGAHMPYFAHEWLLCKYSLDEFPCRMIGLKTAEEFYCTYQAVLVPAVIMNTDATSLDVIAKVLKISPENLLQQNISKVVVHIFPFFSQAAKNATSEHQVKQAYKCYELVKEFIDEELVEAASNEHLEDIVVDVLLRLQDQELMASSRKWRSLEMAPNSPALSLNMVMSTLEYLTAEGPLVAALGLRQDGMWRVLMSLLQEVFHTHRPHVRLRCLSAFGLFVRQLLKEFHSALSGNCAFVLRSIIHFTLLLLKPADHSDTNLGNYTFDINCLCCDLLTETCAVAVQTQPQDVSRHLSEIVSQILPHAIQENSKFSCKCVQLLNLLLVENASRLQDAIALLDILPADVSVLKAAHATQIRIKHKGSISLHKEMSYFVQAREANPLSHSEPGLKALLQLLKDHKHQMEEITKSSSGVLRNFISHLLCLCQSSDSGSANLALDCLGEIGPVKLNGDVEPKKAKPSLARALVHFKADSRSIKYCHIFHTLDLCLVDDNVDVVCTAGSVFKLILATQSGIAFCTEYKKIHNDQLLAYLHPFKLPPGNRPLTTNKDRKREEFLAEVDREDLWSPEHSDYAHWLQCLVVTIIKSGAIHDEILCHLWPLCKIKTSLCELILPFLIHEVLLHGDQLHKEVLTKQIALFFKKHLQHNARKSRDVFEKIVLNPLAVEQMLNIVQYLRKQPLPRKRDEIKTLWDSNFWLDLDFSSLSKAAVNIKSFYTALLFAEISCNIGRTLNESSAPRANPHFKEEDCLSAAELSILKEAYVSLGDGDSIRGCVGSSPMDQKTQIQTYEWQKNWSKALTSHDICLSSAGGSHTGLLNALTNLGCNHVLNAYLSNVKTEDVSQLAEMQFEAAWKQCNWDLSLGGSTKPSLHLGLYTSLIGLKHKDWSLYDNGLVMTRRSLFERVPRLKAMENVQNVYSFMSYAHCLRLVQDVAIDLQEQGSAVAVSSESDLFFPDYECLEPVLVQKVALSNITSEKNAMFLELKKYSQLAANSGQHQVAEGLIERLKTLVPNVVSDERFLEVRLAEAELYWKREEMMVAMPIMKQLIAELDQGIDESCVHLLPKCLTMYGAMLAETHSENPLAIYENYLQRAVVLIEQDASAEGQEALPVLARFADHHHQSIVEYMKSATFETKRLMVQEAKAKLEEINAVLKGQGSDRYMNILSVQSSIDEAELAQLTKDRSFFLLTAMRAYIRCLQGSSAYDLRGFRLVSLWLANNSESEVNQLMMTELKKLPSYKFLGLIPQLAARLSSEKGSLFQKALQQLLLSCLTEHPHHSVPVILALAHADLCTLAEEAKRPKKGSRLGRGASVSKRADDTQEARTAAQMLLQKLQKSKRHRNFTEWEALSKALVELAYLDVPAQSRKSVAPINMPRDLAITKMSDLQHVGVPTIDVKIDISCEYTDLVKVVNFSRTFKLAGGVNLPKIIQCLGSDGIQRQQLIKGRDDLRQDAVMQQVFQLVNNLLDATPATAKRNLNIRTYKVVPLSQRSGLLEWCQGTMPIGMYLIVKGGGAHRIYRPKDATAEECRKKIYTARMNKGDRLAAYQSVCRDMKPVFRHFFLERFLEPDQWYTKRLAYTRSVATNSMVGYILGLGDRHVQNILIDETSAEMINIDLGIAFEQGKILPTPETVPFRLTRDIVDGMGVTGVEGAFRRCCEECLRVLRKSEEHLLTILEVLLVDPLYDWKMSPMKAMKLQDMRPNDPDTTMGNIFEDETSNSRDSKSDNGNIVAERALMRLRQKLQGREHGAQLSHQGQVNLLIQEAMDPRNLSRLFEGWQPYL